MTDIIIQNGPVKLAASVYGRLDKPAVLFLHGISLSRDGWQEIAGALSDRYLIYTLDFRGHGHSDQSTHYDLSDYISDAQAALAAIAKPTIVVGHSLGGCVAGVLAQSGDPLIRAVFLIDPPWYLGRGGEWQKSAFPKLFAAVRDQQQKWQREQAPLSTYLQFASSASSPMGGVASDHFSFRHLLSHASAVQRQDPRCWDNLVEMGELLSVIDTAKPFKCPTTIIQADVSCGEALLEGHDRRLRETTANTEVLFYKGCGHRPHWTKGFDQRFLQDLQNFLSRQA